MVWALGILIVIAIALGALVAKGRLGEMAPQMPDIPGPDLPDGELTSKDLDDVTFAVVTRGYEMSQVDALIARLQTQLQSHEPADDALVNAPSQPDHHAEDQHQMGEQAVDELAADEPVADERVVDEQPESLDQPSSAGPSEGGLHASESSLSETARTNQ